jgi:acetyl esterase/lipase
MRSPLFCAFHVVAAFATVALPLVQAQSHPPVDTSFTTSSAWQKLLPQYPDAVPASVPASPNVHEWHGLVYATYGSRKLSLDLFAPTGATGRPYPGVLIIHGGGWRSGSRTMETPMARALASAGYVTAVVEYRLSGEAHYPAGVHDLKAAVRWMRAHAAKYGIDPQRLAAMGPSAGGTLAALLGATGDRKELEGNGGFLHVSSAVQAVVDIDGVVDFTDSAESGKDLDPAKPSAGRLWFGYTYADRPDLWREASALNWVTPVTPPFAFINSSLDRFHAGRDPMIARLTALGIYSEVHTIPNTPHPFWLMHPWFEQTVKLAAGFLDRVLKQHPHP